MGAAINNVEAFWGADWSRDISWWSPAPTTSSRCRRRRTAVTVGGYRGGGRRRSGRSHAPGGGRPADRVRAGRGGDECSGIANCVDATSFFTTRRAPTPHSTRRAGWPKASPISSARPSTPVPADARSQQVALPPDAELDTPGPQRSLAYDRAWWFARFVADTFGTPSCARCISPSAAWRTPTRRRRPRRTRHRRGRACSRGWQQWMVRLA